MKTNDEKALKMAIDVIKATGGNEGAGLLLQRLHVQILGLMKGKPAKWALCASPVDFTIHWFWHRFRLLNQKDQGNLQKLMAKPIKDTPTLKGKDARVFMEIICESKNSKVTEEERERMKKNFQLFESAIVKK